MKCRSQKQKDGSSFIIIATRFVISTDLQSMNVRLWFGSLGWLTKVRIGENIAIRDIDTTRAEKYDSHECYAFMIIMYS